MYCEMIALRDMDSNIFFYKKSSNIFIAKSCHFEDKHICEKDYTININRNSNFVSKDNLIYFKDNLVLSGIRWLHELEKK